MSTGHEEGTWKHPIRIRTAQFIGIQYNSINFSDSTTWIVQAVSGRSPGHLWLWVLRSELLGVAGLEQTNRGGKVSVMFDGHKRLVEPELAFFTSPGSIDSLAASYPKYHWIGASVHWDVRLSIFLTGLTTGSSLSILPTSSSSSTSTKSSLSTKLISTGQRVYLMSLTPLMGSMRKEGMNGNDLGTCIKKHYCKSLEVHAKDITGITTY